MHINGWIYKPCLEPVVGKAKARADSRTNKEASSQGAFVASMALLRTAELSGRLISSELLHEDDLVLVNRFDAERLEVCACVMANQKPLSLGNSDWPLMFIPGMLSHGGFVMGTSPVRTDLGVKADHEYFMDLEKSLELVHGGYR